MKKRTAYIKCFLCGKEVKCNPKKSVDEEARRHKFWKVDLRAPSDFEDDVETFYICDECIAKIFKRAMTYAE